MYADLKTRARPKREGDMRYNRDVYRFKDSRKAEEKVICDTIKMYADLKDSRKAEERR